MQLLLLLLLFSTALLSGCGAEHRLSQIRGAARRVSQVANCPNHASSTKDDSQTKIILSLSDKESVKVKYSHDHWPSNTIERLVSSGFNTSAPTIVYSHGWISGTRTFKWEGKVRRDAFELAEAPRKHRINLMLLDWSKYARLPYRMSVAHVPHVGKVLGELVEMLHTRLGYAPQMWHLVGYSLSTHVMGQAGRYVASHVGQQVRQITAVDPTGVCLHGTKFGDKYGLAPSDAQLVVARHYDVGGLGSKRPIGGLDIYVNGGKLSRGKRSSADQDVIVLDIKPGEQVGVDGDLVDFDDESIVVGSTKDHLKAIHHEADMHKSACGNMAYVCSSYEALKRGECKRCGSRGEHCYNMSNLDYERYIADTGRVSGKGRAPGYPLGTKMYARLSGNDCT